MQVPFSFPSISENAIEEVTKTLKSGWLTSGKKVREFESLFANKVQAKHALSVHSATAGLHLCLAAIDLSENEAVITTSVTFFATVEVICYFKAQPILTDVDKNSHLMTKKTLLECIERECEVKNNQLFHRKTNKKVKAILPVHLAGLSCEMEDILIISKRYNLYVIEDAAHSFPTIYQNRMIGSWGDFTVFSFHATKPLTTGEGGMITTNREKFIEKIQLMRLHGIDKDAYTREKKQDWFYKILTLGYKYNMSDISASIGIEQLKESDSLYKKRKRIVDIYFQEMSSCKEIELPQKPKTGQHSWHLFRIGIDDIKLNLNRDLFMEKLGEQGIQTSLHYIPIYEHLYIKKNYHFRKSDFQNANQMYRKTLSLPLFSAMTEKQAIYVTKSIKKILRFY